jgi:hypothetical protein
MFVEIELHLVAQKFSENPRRFRLDAARLKHATAQSWKWDPPAEGVAAAQLTCVVAQLIRRLCV